MGRLVKRLAIILAVIAGAAAAASWWRSAGEDPAAHVRVRGTAMGSNWSVTLSRPPRDLAERARAAAQAALDAVDRQMSHYRDDSDLSRFNAHAGTDWFAVPAELAEVVALARHVGDATDGALDVTIAPLVDLWGFGPERRSARVPPSDEAIAAARPHVGRRLVEVRRDPPALRKLDPAVRLDLSSVAPGHAADRVAAALDALGATDYLVDVGGELRGRGVTREGRPWRVGVEAPVPGARQVLRIVELSGVALATSGDYRNFFEHEGRRYPHILDPRTGRPIDHALASVSVIAPTAAEADAWATALLVCGPEDGPARARSLGLAAMFVTRQGETLQVHTTPGWDARAPVDPNTSRRAR